MKNISVKSIKQRVLSKVCAVLFALGIMMFSVITPITKVSALAVPEIEPIINTTVEQLYNYVEYRLTPAQQDAFDLLLGSAMVGYAGLSQYHLRYIYGTDAPVKEWLINCGVDLYNTIVDLGMISPNKIKDTQAILNLALSCAEKALTYTDVNDLVDDIENSTDFKIQIEPNVMYGINQVLAQKGGLYQWQFKSNILSPSNLSSSLTYKQTSMSANTQVTYISYLDELQLPRVRFNTGGSNDYNAVASADIFTVYHNLFANLHNNVLYLCDDLGNIAPVENIIRQVYVHKYGSNESAFSEGLFFYTQSVNINGYNNIKEIYDDLCNNVIKVISNSSPFWLSDFIQGMYYGDTWETKQPWTEDTDLNLAENDYEYVMAPVETVLLDIKGLLSDLVNTLSLKEPVLDNLTYPDAQPVPETALEKISVEVKLPESGVVLPDGLFTPVKGFMDYMWYMTKPLIVFTNDILSCLIYGEAGGFTNTGPTVFIYGIIAFGLIGGLITKCLL